MLLNFAKSCVFSKQSLLPRSLDLLFATEEQFHHFPKLRSQFAEFLRYRFSNHLSILCLPISVDF